MANLGTALNHGQANANFYSGNPYGNFGRTMGPELTHAQQSGMNNGQGHGTLGSLGNLLNIDNPYWRERAGQKVTNYYTVVQEILRGQEITLFSALLDTAFAIQACAPLLAIVAPYFKTNLKTFHYVISGMNIFPAQPTTPGVPERTNSTTEMRFSTSTREYGISAMCPIEVLYTEFENEIRRTIMISMMALSLSMAFIQVVLVHFC